MSAFDLFNPRPAKWDAVEDARAILAAGIAEHNPSSVWALFSGGHDSLVATHIAAQHPRFSGVVHIRTGIGIKETPRFVYETCKRFGWPLRMYRPLARDRYESFVMQHGFPGPAQHGRMYQRLKERSLDRHVQSVKTRWNDRIVLVTGCRLAESRRRMGHVEPVQRVKTKVWIAPTLRWETADQHDYMAAHGLPRNPVKDTLCMSGECLCGAFAEPGELQDIALWYPQAADEIRAIEERVAAAGVRACRWGHRPPAACEPVDEAQLAIGGGIGTMCWTCDAKREAREDARRGAA